MFFLYRLAICLNLLLMFGGISYIFVPSNEESQTLFWGLDLLSKLARGKPWENNAIFPRTAVCDFERLVFNNKHNFLIVCNLNYNPLNEKLFLFSWLTMTGLVVTSCLNLVYFAFQLNRVGNLKKRLKIAHPLQLDKRASEKFLVHIGQNGQDLICVFNQAAEMHISSALLGAMYNEYSKSVELTSVICTHAKED